MQIKLRPLGNNLILKRAAPQAVTAGGIYLADSAQKKPHRGTVIAAGPGRHLETGFEVTECKPGDVVIFPDGLGHEVEVDGETYLMLAEDLVLCIVETDEGGGS